MISIVTPTIRKEGLALVAKALQKQTHEEWEWLIGSQFDPEIDFATWIPDDFEGGYWSLNRIYNKLFQEAKGELVVTWQDFIYTSPTSLEAFWDDFVATRGNGCISGVGDQYSELDALGKPANKVWDDPRKSFKHNASFYPCYWNDIEWNLAAIPKKLFFAVGGMDEGLDFLGYGGDQLQCSQRMADFGSIEFYLDRTIESYTLRHDRSDFGGQEAWDGKHVLFNGRYEKRRKQLIDTGNWPVLVDFGRGVLLEEKGGEE